MPHDSLVLNKAHSRLSLGHVAIAAYGIAMASLAIHFAIYLRHALGAVTFPFGLDYGEGIIWQQALLIPGERMYGDITRFPFIVFHYPPLYHLGVRALNMLGFDMLAAGRALSLGSTLLTGLIVAALAYDIIGSRIDRNTRLMGAVIAGLTVFCYVPVIFWSTFMRVDMLAILWTCLGVWLAGRASRAPWLLYLAVLAFVAATYTKQSCIAAPLSVLPVALATNRRHALGAYGVGAALGLAALLFLTWRTDGGFIRHLLFYNLNRFSLRFALSSIYHDGTRHTIFFVLALAGIAAGWREHLRARDTALSFSVRIGQSRGPLRLMAIVTLWFILTTASLVACGKSGSAKNYLIEWMCVWSVMIGMLNASAIDFARTGCLWPDEPEIRRRRIMAAVVVPLALTLQVLVVPPAGEPSSDEADRTRQLESLVARIKVAGQPVLSDDMVLLLRAGQEVPWEPAIFTELASTGRWNEQPILDMITHHAWAFIITEGQPGDLIYDTRYTPAVDRAIREYYPRLEVEGGRLLHLPPA